MISNTERSRIDGRLRDAKSKVIGHVIEPMIGAVDIEILNSTGTIRTAVPVIVDQDVFRQRVIARTTNHQIVWIIRRTEIRRSPKINILDVGDTTYNKRIITTRIIIDIILPIGVERKHVGIAARSTQQEVIPGTACQNVGTGRNIIISIKEIVACPTVKGVIVVAANERVISGFTGQEIVFVVSKEQIVASPSIDTVVTVPAIQCIVAFIAG